MERRETNVVRDESTGVVTEESHVSRTSPVASIAADATEIVRKVSPGRRAHEVVYLVFGIVTGLLLIRLLLKVLGSSAQAPFAGFIYGVTDFLLAPFRGLLPAIVNGRSVFEPSILIAVVVYILLAVVIAKIIAITFSRSEVVAHRRSRDLTPHSD
ncbi:MAG: YggT family protein [Candidatus Dormibacteraeota bacterium]|nr:YggT family protein [Candidatus Dormibacteraeota bacterium]